MAARTAFTLIGLALLVIAGIVIARQPSLADRERELRLIHERDILAAESLRSFRAHERLQQAIPEYRPASKPAPGQRDA